ncbi:hypothetical protein ACF0H5_008168 [Mactra antiquata]
MASKKMDAEYNAMRRRMSRLRVKCNNKGASLEAEDATDDSGDFKDLIKFWKKHGIPIPKELVSDMADENVKRAKAKGQGRRRSRELEDLHMCASTGKFNLEHMSLEELEENEEDGEHPSELKTKHVQKKPISRRNTDSLLNSKTRGGSLKKTGSRSIMNGTSSPSTPRKLGRTVSNK